MKGCVGGRSRGLRRLTCRSVRSWRTKHVPQRVCLLCARFHRCKSDRSRCRSTGRPHRVLPLGLSCLSGSVVGTISKLLAFQRRENHSNLCSNIPQCASTRNIRSIQAKSCFYVIFCTRGRLMWERLWQTALADHCIYKRLKNLRLVKLEVDFMSKVFRYDVPLTSATLLKILFWTVWKSRWLPTLQ